MESRVPVNGIDSESLLKNLKWAPNFGSHRMARFYKVFDEPPPSMLPSVAMQGGRPEGIENPLVIASLIAGLAGITIIIIILLSIWILKKASPKPYPPYKHQNGLTNGNGYRVTDIKNQEESDVLSIISTPSSMSVHLHDEVKPELLKTAVRISRETAV